ncbi:MAG: hypothetical protein ACYC7D_09935 [Nitrososphaerales archaeon]
MITLLILLDLPTWQSGDPSYAATYVISTVIALLILGICLAASLRKGTQTVRNRNS